MVKKIPAESYFGEKKSLQIVMLKKRNSYSEEIGQVPPLKLNGPSPMRMEAHDLVYLQEFFHQNKSLQESLCSE